MKGTELNERGDPVTTVEIEDPRADGACRGGGAPAGVEEPTTNDAPERLSAERLAAMGPWWRAIARTLEVRDMAGTVCSAHLRSACADIAALVAEVERLQVTERRPTVVRSEHRTAAERTDGDEAEERPCAAEAWRPTLEEGSERQPRWTAEADPRRARAARDVQERGPGGLRRPAADCAPIEVGEREGEGVGADPRSRLRSTEAGARGEGAGRDEGGPA